MQLLKVHVLNNDVKEVIGIKSKMDIRNLSTPATAEVMHLNDNTNVPHSTKHVVSVIGGDITQNYVEQKTQKIFAQWIVKKSLFL